MRIILGQPHSFCQAGKRDYQEDSRFPDTDKPERNTPFFLVCDGVGGCEKGEMASKTVCDAFHAILSRTHWEEPFTEKSFQMALDHAYDSLQQISNDSNRGMATTLAFAAFHSNGCTVAHIGDSRVYHVRPSEGILYRSDDHSLVNFLVHSGNLTPEEAIDHPNSNVITRCINIPDEGEERAAATVMQIKDIAIGDYVFLCSDGVLHTLTDHDLLAILSSADTDEEKMSQIAERSKESEDNNTAILIPITEVQPDNDFDDMEYPIPENSGTNTVTFIRKPEQTREVKSYQKQTLGNKICIFFKKLF